MSRAVIFISVLWISLFLFPWEVSAQKQLILLKREKVILRLYSGDEIIFSLKNDKRIIHSYINNLSDTALVAHKDVIPLEKIDRIYFVQRKFTNVIGGLLVTGGVGYFLLDQANMVLVHKEGFDLDKNVSIASAVMIGAGLPLMLMKKKYQELGGRYRLRVAEPGSVFYRPDLRESIPGMD